MPLSATLSAPLEITPKTPSSEPLFTLTEPKRLEPQKKKRTRKRPTTIDVPQIEDDLPIPPVPENILQKERESWARWEREKAFKTLSNLSWERNEQDSEYYVRHELYRRQLERAGRIRHIGEDSTGMDKYEAIPRPWVDVNDKG